MYSLNASNGFLFSLFFVLACAFCVVFDEIELLDALIGLT
jgi:hypothetical protein